MLACVGYVLVWPVLALILSVLAQLWLLLGLLLGPVLAWLGYVLASVGRVLACVGPALACVGPCDGDGDDTLCWLALAIFRPVLAVLAQSWPVLAPFLSVLAWF